MPKYTNTRVCVAPYRKKILELYNESFNASFQEKDEAERIEAEKRYLREQKIGMEKAMEFLMNLSIESKRIEAERIEAERLNTERIEAERLNTERIEAERIEAERIEAERIEAERIEAERIEAERLNAERIEAENLKIIKLKVMKMEKQKLWKIEMDKFVNFKLGGNILDRSLLQNLDYQVKNPQKSETILDFMKTINQN